MISCTQYSEDFLKKRELLVLVIHFGALLGATALASNYYSERYATYDIVDTVLSLSLLGFLVLCLSVIPYQIITRNYSIVLKVVGVLGCLAMAFGVMAMVFGMSWGRVKW
ncbi:MAG: putative ferric reductase [Litorivivens sp.]